MYAPWSKAQKDANISLHRFLISKEKKNFQVFLNGFKTSEEDHIARVEMQKPYPNYSQMRFGFIQGHIHPEDIDSVYNLFSRFYWVRLS